MSKEKPSRSTRRTAPPYVCVRSYTATRWPATASRAAAAIAPIPAPITAIRAMPGTLSATTGPPVRGPVRGRRFADRRGSTDADVVAPGGRAGPLGAGAQP
ncbi:hypothetical protein GCM10010421_59270 [Streptomyces glaucus]|uniref:Secreted protein n=1 Tax=Streptomyces glaucus TaxID=284029 RepID=A0ABN3KIS2_9ACTN